MSKKTKGGAAAPFAPPPRSAPEVLTGINSILRFLYKFSKKYQVP